MRSLFVGAAVALSIMVGSAVAAPVTGNPAADGWTLQGRSTDTGTFVRKGTGKLYDFAVYSIGFVLDGSSPLASVSAAWQGGDRILGLGGVANEALDETFRTVNKWGAATSTYAADSNGPGIPPDDGVGSSSSGAGGLGSMLTGFNYTRTNGALDGA